MSVVAIYVARKNADSNPIPDRIQSLLKGLKVETRIVDADTGGEVVGGAFQLVVFESPLPAPQSPLLMQALDAGRNATLAMSKPQLAIIAPEPRDLATRSIDLTVFHAEALAASPLTRDAPLTDSWRALLEMIGTGIGRPGLVSYLDIPKQLQLVSPLPRAEALDEWVKSHPGDPLAEAAWRESTDLRLSTKAEEIRADAIGGVSETAYSQPIPVVVIAPPNKMAGQMGGSGLVDKLSNLGIRSELVTSAPAADRGALGLKVQSAVVIVCGEGQLKPEVRQLVSTADGASIINPDVKVIKLKGEGAGQAADLRMPASPDSAGSEDLPAWTALVTALAEPLKRNGLPAYVEAQMQPTIGDGERIERLRAWAVANPTDPLSASTLDMAGRRMKDLDRQARASEFAELQKGAAASANVADPTKRDEKVLPGPWGNPAGEQTVKPEETNAPRKFGKGIALLILVIAAIAGGIAYQWLPIDLGLTPTQRQLALLDGNWRPPGGSCEDSPFEMSVGDASVLPAVIRIRTGGDGGSYTVRTIHEDASGNTIYMLEQDTWRFIVSQDGKTLTEIAGTNSRIEMPRCAS